MTGYPTPHRKRRRRIWPWIVGALALLLCGGLGVALLSSASPPDTAVSLAPEQTARPAAKPVPKTSVRPNTIREGTWKVGEEVKAGSYRTAGAEQGIMMYCYWIVSRDDASSDVVDTGAVNSADEPGRVTLKAGQYFKTSGCQEWYATK